MEITEVRIKLVHESQDRLLAFCSITIDGAFVVRDLKIIQGTRGAFVAMPSRKLMDRCRKCGGKNALRASYCNQCGGRLPDDRAPKETDGRAKLYADIAHPINQECREMIQSAVIVAYEQEQILSQDPNYVCRYDDFGENDTSLPEEFDSVDFEIGRPPGATRGSSGTQRIEPPSEQPAGPPHAGARAPDASPAGSKRSQDPEFGDGIG